MLINLDFDNISDELVYTAFGVEGNEADALNDSYLELFELIGRDAMLKLFKHFRGDKIDCPMRLYSPEFIADLSKHVADRRERAKIARAVLSDGTTLIKSVTASGVVSETIHKLPEIASVAQRNEVIRDLAKQKINQETIAAMLDVSQSTVSNVLRKK